MAHVSITDPAFLVAISAAVAAISGIPALFIPRRPALGQVMATVAMVIAAVLGFFGITSFILSGSASTLSIFDSLPFGPCQMGLDHLSAFFLLPVFLISTCCSIYGTRYWAAAVNEKTFHKLTFFFGVLTAALVTLITAKSSMLFLLAWEVMALSAFFVLTTEDHKPEVQEAGLLYMVATHTGTLALFAMFSLLGLAASSYQFEAMAASNPSAPLAAAIFCTALFGFGMKAGLMPLHVWLPSAHASAPSHISAIMSGVMIKTGVYGMLRVLSFFPQPPLWWGITLLVAGTVSAVLGVTFALGQHDLKRLLAYHSIENIGIIFIGMGLATIGQTTGQPVLALLGMSGALLHTLNHALFKSLLFLGAGSAIDASHTREIDLMGGLAKRLPWTAAMFLLGAAAICGLPPLNGFVSEFLIYMGIFHGVNNGSGASLPIMALAAPALALVGALAVACFVKAFGIVFLGEPRSKAAEQGHESGWAMRTPMILLAVCCFSIGLFPQMTLSILQPAVHSWAPNLTGIALPSAVPLGWITVMGVLLLLAGSVGAAWLHRAFRSSPMFWTVTWGCGYLRPSPRMQYTSSSFAEMLIKLFAGLLRPHADLPEISGVAPPRSHFSSHVPEAVLELVIKPAFAAVDLRFNRIRHLQHGQLPLYILYVFVTLCLLLAWAI